MVQSLLDIISEQADFSFTGKINVLSKENNQFIAAVYQFEGFIIKCNYGKFEGKKALFNLLVASLRPSVFRFVSEPELVSEDMAEFKLDKPQLIKELQYYINEIQECQRLKPPAHIKIAINPDFISHGDNVSHSEFEILKLLTEYSKVTDIYKNSTLLENEVTLGLVGLRKKRALRVVS